MMHVRHLAANIGLRFGTSLALIAVTQEQNLMGLLRESKASEETHSSNSNIRYIKIIELYSVTTLAQFVCFPKPPFF